MVLEYLAQLKLRTQYRTVLTIHQLQTLPTTLAHTYHTIEYTVVQYKNYIVQYIHEYKAQKQRQQYAEQHRTHAKLQQAKLLLSQAQQGTLLNIDELLASDSDTDDTDVLEFDKNILNDSLSDKLIQSLDFNQITTQLQSITTDLYNKAVTVLTPGNSTHNTPSKPKKQQNVALEGVTVSGDVPCAPPILSPMSPPTSRVKKSGLHSIKQPLFTENTIQSQTGSTAFPTVPTPVSQSPLLQHCIQKRSTHTKTLSNEIVVATTAPPPPPPPSITDYTKVTVQQHSDDSNKENEDSVSSLESTTRKISARKQSQRTTVNTIMTPSPISTDSLQKSKSILKPVQPVVNTARTMPGTENMSFQDQIKFVAKLNVLKKIDLQRSPGGTPARQRTTNDDTDTLKNALFSKFKNTGLRKSKGRISTGVTADAWDT